MSENILLLLQDYGLWGMLVLCFAEACCLPIPPELLFVPLCLAEPGKAMGFALLAAIATVSGSFLGYVLGKVLGHPLLHRLVSTEKVVRIEKAFQRYGVWVVFLAGVAPPPTPFKIFTISSGIFALNPPRFFLAALFGRGIRYLIEAVLIWQGGRSSFAVFKHHSGLITIVLSLVILIALLIYNKRFRSRVEGVLIEKILPTSWIRFLGGEGRVLKVIGEWAIALGSAAFLTFFLADIVKQTGLRHLHQSDMIASLYIKPCLPDFITWIGEGFGPVLLSLVLLSTGVWWYLHNKKDHILFLLFNLLGAVIVVIGFDHILLSSYRLTGGQGTIPMALVNTLWASYVMWMVTGGRPTYKGRKSVIQVIGLGFLVFLALARIGAGYLLSDVLIAYATAGLWMVVVWIILLYRSSPEHNQNE